MACFLILDVSSERVNPGKPLFFDIKQSFFNFYVNKKLLNLMITFGIILNIITVLYIINIMLQFLKTFHTSQPNYP